MGRGFSPEARARRIRIPTIRPRSSGTARQPCGCHPQRRAAPSPDRSAATGHRCNPLADERRPLDLDGRRPGSGAGTTARCASRTDRCRRDMYRTHPTPSRSFWRPGQPASALNLAMPAGMRFKFTHLITASSSTGPSPINEAGLVACKHLLEVVLHIDDEVGLHRRVVSQFRIHCDRGRRHGRRSATDPHNDIHRRPSVRVRRHRCHRAVALLEDDVASAERASSRASGD